MVAHVISDDSYLNSTTVLFDAPHCKLKLKFDVCHKQKLLIFIRFYP